MTAATADKPSPTPARPASEDERREKVADGTVSGEAILPEEKVAGLRAPRPPVLAQAAPPAPAEAPRANGPAAHKADALASRSETPTQGLSEVTTTSRRAPGPAPTEAPTIANSAAGKPEQLADRGRAQEPAPSEVQGGGADSATDSVTTLGARSYADISLPRASATRQAPAAAPPSVAASGTSPGSAASSPSVAPPAAPPRSAASTPASPSTGMASSSTAPEGEQPALAKRKAAASPHPQDPQTWLRQIAALRAEGKAAQADAEMRRFRSIFPAYPAKPGPSAPSEPPK
jgi:hypothetical protein